MIKVCFFDGLDFGEGPHFVTGQNNRQMHRRAKEGKTKNVTRLQ